MRFPRRGGILAHLTSLPGPFGIGDLGPDSLRFADFLSDSGIKLWQILPLSPIGPGNCPYSSASAFAGNPLLIDLEALVEEGLLAPGDLVSPPSFPVDRVDFGRVIRFKRGLLRKAFRQFLSGASVSGRRDFKLFGEENSFWLEDYALFVALQEKLSYRPWYRWPAPLVRREGEALKEAGQELSQRIEEVRFQQYLFSRQWNRFRRQVNSRGLDLVGDLPFFVNRDSADTWANRALFLVDSQGRRSALSGVPPPQGGRTGQVWGNPLYDWKNMRRDGYDWWYRRFRRVLSLVDVVRVDHFSGFYACWHIPPRRPSSRNGVWVKGPGAALFRTLGKRLGQSLPIIAEALEAEIEKPVDRLMSEFSIPGIRELQFGLEGAPGSYHHPGMVPKNCAYYTGLHDNDTCRGWYRSLKPEKKKEVRKFLGVGAREIHWGMIETVFRSKADTVIVPFQEPLGVGRGGRMNIPGRATGQWEWRFKKECLTGELAGYLSRLARETGR
ncbi:MAG: 4-alpha-glucanotransferase [Candidatus Erginobacter occultus]|nr:4-alpha-glucanotransferase [Candidatus Erginobacter occultus]